MVEINPLRPSFEEIKSFWKNLSNFDRRRICEKINLPLLCSEQEFSKIPLNCSRILLQYLSDLMDKTVNKQNQDTSTNRSKGEFEKPSYYEILGVPKNASNDEIKEGFRRMILKFHADKNKEFDDVDEYSKLLYEAKNNLLDPHNRRTYDRSLVH